jgi:hypothetical protein
MCETQIYAQGPCAFDLAEGGPIIIGQLLTSYSTSCNCCVPTFPHLIDDVDFPLAVHLGLPKMK